MSSRWFWISVVGMLWRLEVVLRKLSISSISCWARCPIWAASLESPMVGVGVVSVSVMCFGPVRLFWPFQG